MVKTESDAPSCATEVTVTVVVGERGVEVCRLRDERLAVGDLEELAVDLGRRREVGVAVGGLVGLVVELDGLDRLLLLGLV